MWKILVRRDTATQYFVLSTLNLPQNSERFLYVEELFICCFVNRLLKAKNVISYVCNESKHQ